MFTHKDIWHILFNMLWLYWFGRIFLEYLDGRKLVAVYLLGGICGALVYILSFNIFPVFTGIVSRFSCYWSFSIGDGCCNCNCRICPRLYYQSFIIRENKNKIYGAWYIYSYLNTGLFSQFRRETSAYRWGIFGYFYIMNLKHGHDIGKGINRIIDFFATLFKPRKKLRVTHKKVADEFEYNKIKAEHQKRINRILIRFPKVDMIA